MNEVWYVQDEESGLIDGYYTNEIGGRDALKLLMQRFPKRSFTLHSTNHMSKFNNDFFMKYATWYDKEFNYGN
jgi:hypothetical protein